MSDPVARYLAIRDACAASGGVLAAMARAMDDHLASGTPIFHGLGLYGRWQSEARREMRRRSLSAIRRPQQIAVAKPNASAKARAILKALRPYLAERWPADLLNFQATGQAPAGADESLFRIAQRANGKLPSLRSVRRWCGR